ncbi:hypothetical protein BDQ17DRAFT_1430359 [Cyathus striatus]|nr:hypothetical protein BDQ17DRAFT_1430359 [Cyathus striatus]
MTYNLRRGLKRKHSSNQSHDNGDISVPNKKSSRDNDECNGFFRHPKYYLKDGDFILKVQTILFRTHIRLLKTLGGIFADMFSLEQPTDAERIDGVPYYDLYGLASPREVKFLLAYLYEDIKLTSSTAAGDTWIHWNACISLLRVSQRHGMKDLRCEVIKAFKLFFPLSEKPTSFCPLVTGVTNADRTVFKRTFAIQAINAFHECDIPGLLPLAYYHAAQLPVQTILEGAMDTEGVVQKLDTHDIHIVLLGRESLKASRRTNLFGWLADMIGHGQGVKGCKECFGRSNLAFDDTCYGFMLRMYLDFHRHGFFDTANSLEMLSGEALKTVTYALCTPCKETVLTNTKMGLEKSWKDIPKIFRWTGWKEVIDCQTKIDSD